MGNATGQVRSLVKLSDGQESAQSRAGHTLVRGSCDADTEYYVQDGGDAWSKVPRPVATAVTSAEIPADGVTAFSVALPDGTEVRNDGFVRGLVEDGAFEFVSMKPGRYEFQLRPPFPYQWTVIVVTVNAL